MELTIFHFIVVGFVAQLIDGSLGMAYGVSSNTFLLSLGLPPASISPKSSPPASPEHHTGVSAMWTGIWLNDWPCRVCSGA